MKKSKKALTKQAAKLRALKVRLATLRMTNVFTWKK